MLNENISYMNDDAPMTGRLTPIGSSSSDIEFDNRSVFLFYSIFLYFYSYSFNENVALIEEQEKLNASLAALTRHVAHVQLRLQQVVSAPTAEDREVK